MRNVSFQLELDLLDRQWLVQREQLMVRDSSGHLTVPSQTRLVLIAATVLPACAAWIVGFLLIGSGVSVLGVFVATPVGVWLGIAYSQLYRYRKRRTEYDAARTALCDRYFHGDPQQSDAPVAGMSEYTTSAALLPVSKQPGRDASQHEIAALDHSLERMRLEGELARLKLDFERFRTRVERETVHFRDLADLKTHSTAVSPFLSIGVAIILLSAFGGWGLLATVAFTVAAFIVEVRIRNWLLAREITNRRSHFEAERRRLQSQIEIHQKAA